MTVQRLEKRLPDFFRIMGTHLANSVVKHFCINAAPGKKIPHTIPEYIIHDMKLMDFVDQLAGDNPDTLT